MPGQLCTPPLLLPVLLMRQGAVEGRSYCSDGQRGPGNHGLRLEPRQPCSQVQRTSVWWPVNRIGILGPLRGCGGGNPRDRGGSCYGLARNSLRITAHCPGWVLTWGVSWIHSPDPKRLERVSDPSVPTLAPPAPCPAPGGVPRPLPSAPPGPLHTPTCQAGAPPFWPLPPSPSQEPSWSLEVQGSGKLVLGASDGSCPLGNTP